ncbi:ankyrin-3 isoform X2 [Halyomorpha halys]|nr:ankyrin-3-like isoform X2 [Halyomorpha halys]
MAAAGTITQAMINESFGLKRLLALTEEYVHEKITSAVDYAAATTSGDQDLDRANLRTDQCYTLALLFGLIKQDAALCSILGMSSEFFEPLPVAQLFPWLKDGFQFTRDDLLSALKYAAKMKKQQISIPCSAFKAIVQLAKENGVISNASDDQELNELLESVGSEVPPVNPELQKSLHDAVLANSPEVVKATIEKGADPNYIPEVGNSYVHLAIKEKCLTAVSTLLEAGARIDGENSEGETPLCTAVRERNLEAINLLLNKGAKVNYLNACGHTAVHVAARAGFGDVIELLIDHGPADLSVTDSSGNTALHWAAAVGRDDIVQLLQKKGASVNTVSRSGWTPLHAASEYNHMKVVSMLIECGAELDALGEGGYTPLHMAADKGHIEIVKLLVSKGAKLKPEASDGSTPADMAKDSGHEEVLQFLQEKSS